jgi:hypothetical protein
MKGLTNSRVENVDGVIEGHLSERQRLKRAAEKLG